MILEIIPKETFVIAIDSIRKQMLKDKTNSIVLSEVFPGSELASYDNSKLIKSILELLRIWFPRDVEGFCELEHYCFDLDFGKGADEIEGIEKFYDRLVEKSLWNTETEMLGLYSKKNDIKVISHIAASFSGLIL